MTGPPGNIGRGALALALAAVVVGCSSGGGRQDELSRWRRDDVFAHPDVVEYDRVAVAADGQRIAWLTRAPGSTDALAVGVWAQHDELGPTRFELTTVDEPLVVPAAAAMDAEGWTAVATIHDDDGIRSSELVAWDGASSDDVEPVTLDAPAGHVFTGDVSAARFDGRAVVAASTGEEPSTVGLPLPSASFVWTSTGSGQWDQAPLELGGGGALADMTLIADGTRFVVAGIAPNDRPVVFVSSDAQSWDELTATDLPETVEGLDLVTAIGDGTALIGWVTEPSGGTVEVWQLAGPELTAVGPLAAADDIASVSLYAAAVHDEQILVGGWARRPNGLVPMLWAWDDDEWRPSEQPELTGRLDWRLVALGPDDADGLRALLVTPFHIDVETWIWSNPD